jgi:chitin synthase
MEDPSFHLSGINILNVILEYFYVGLLLMCFILALGNRPQGSKLGYTLAFIGFALITIYMTVSLPPPLLVARSGGWMLIA